MVPSSSQVDLAGLGLSGGEGRRLAPAVASEPLTLGGQRYAVVATQTPVVLDVSRMTGGGYALRLRFVATLAGPCMRCLKDAAPTLEVDAREVDRPGAGEELESPYVSDEVLDVAAWAHDAFALTVPTKVLCRPDCAGLCPVCAADLNEAGPGHRHDTPPDPRWAKLRELKLG
ncbi:MAG TPA: DUF177 domain-containing protein [Solirubrobacteraceae bacterium]|nr:DUF177 domain-containing protein [Solirubrobacteraceae bacterium]